MKRHGTLEQFTTEHSATFDRVSRQLNLIRSVDPLEAFDLCMAYTRCFAQIVAQTCDSDEEFIARMIELGRILQLEGLTIRHVLREEAKAQASAPR